MPKKINFLVIDQSNERGTGTAPNKVNNVAVLPTVPGPNVRQRTLFGRSNSVLIAAGTPGTVSTSSVFSALKERVAAHTGWDIGIMNKAQGNTGMVDAWVGRDPVTGLLYEQGQAGYDPSGLINDAVGSAQLAADRGDENWIFAAGGGQNDIAAQRPTAQIIQAKAHVISRIAAVGPHKIFIGRGNRYIGSVNESEWNAPNGKIHLVADGVLAAFPGAYRAGDASASTDVNRCAADSQPLIHLNHVGVLWWAGLIFDDLLAQNVFK